MFHGLILTFFQCYFSHLPSSYLHKLKHLLFHKYMMLEIFFFFF